MIRTFDGQQYELVGEQPHTCHDGTETMLSVWRSHCPTCGEPFETRTPSRARKFQPGRRCPQHKRPGARVALAALTRAAAVIDADKKFPCAARLESPLRWCSPRCGSTQGCYVQGAMGGRKRPTISKGVGGFFASRRGGERTARTVTRRIFLGWEFDFNCSAMAGFFKIARASAAKLRPAQLRALSKCF
jgi:hypothetical protein